MSAPITTSAPLAASGALLIFQGQLLEAMQARHALMIGQQVVTLSYEGKSATFSQVDLFKLDAYIASLKEQIGALTGARIPGGPLVAVF